MSFYWISKQKSLGRHTKFGDKIPNVDKDRVKELIGQGLVSEKKPESVTNAEKNKIIEIQAVNESLREELLSFKEKSKKGASVKLREARGKISELEIQLEEATAPKDK